MIVLFAAVLSLLFAACVTDSKRNKNIKEFTAFFDVRGEEIDEDNEADYFDPDTGELILGDIMISVDRVFSQAESFGHSVRREFAFLVAHSMLHLCGYDHMEDDERIVMERKQEEILTKLEITRE